MRSRSTPQQARIGPEGIVIFFIEVGAAEVTGPQLAGQMGQRQCVKGELGDNFLGALLSCLGFEVENIQLSAHGLKDVDVPRNDPVAGVLQPDGDFAGDGVAVAAQEVVLDGLMPRPVVWRQAQGLQRDTVQWGALAMIEPGVPSQAQL